MGRDAGRSRTGARAAALPAGGAASLTVDADLTAQRWWVQRVVVTGCVAVGGPAPSEPPDAPDGAEPRELVIRIVLPTSQVPPSSTSQPCDVEDDPPRVIGALREQGLRPSDVAAALGVRRGRVWEWETGRVRMGRRSWGRLTALRDVVDTIARHGPMAPRQWLFA